MGVGQHLVQAVAQTSLIPNFGSLCRLHIHHSVSFFVRVLAFHDRATGMAAARIGNLRVHQGAFSCRVTIGT